MTDTTDPQPETALALLYRHGLPEDVIDGALCLHAQELAALQRLRMDELDLTGQKARIVGRIVDLIDPTKTPAAPAAAPSAPADRGALLREAADIAESLRQFEPAAGARKSAQVSENVGILRVAEELRRMADEASGAL